MTLLDVADDAKTLNEQNEAKKVQSIIGGIYKHD